MSRPLSTRATLAVLVVAQISLLVAVVGVIGYVGKVNRAADVASKRASTINRAAILRDCVDKEELKGVMLEIMGAVIAFNESSADPELRKRAITYRALITRLAPRSCNGR